MDSLIKIGTSFIKKSSKFYSFFLKDKSNNHIMIGNYSKKSNIFRYINTEKRAFYVTSIVILISDDGSFNDLKYGNSCNLNNGIKMYIKGLLYERGIFGYDEGIIKNTDWLKYNCETKKIKLGNKLTNLKITFNFHSASDTYIKLYPGESINMLLNDDFSSLFEQTVNITGHYGTKE
jgi:hypothetical protein